MSDSKDPRSIAVSYPAPWTIKTAHKAYEHDGNPLGVWLAYREARETGQPVPDWILTYLDRCSLALLKLAGEEASGKKATDISVSIAEALEMKSPGKGGRGTVFSKYADKMWLFYGARVFQNMAQGDQPEYAIEDVAQKNGVSISKVRRAWKKFEAFTKSPTS